MQVKTQAVSGKATNQSNSPKGKKHLGIRQRADIGRIAAAFSNCPPRLDEKRHSCRDSEYFNIHPFVPCVACLSTLSIQASGDPKEKPALLTRKIPAKDQTGLRTSHPHASTAEWTMTTSAQQNIEISLVSSDNGFKDYDISGHPVVHRITVGANIRKGDNFNVYCKNNRKIGGIWKGNMEKSLITLFERLRTEMAV